MPIDRFITWAGVFASPRSLCSKVVGVPIGRLIRRAGVFASPRSACSKVVDVPIDRLWWVSMGTSTAIAGAAK